MKNQEFDENSWNDFVARLKNDLLTEEENFNKNPLFVVEFATANPVEKNKALLNYLSEKVPLIYSCAKVESIQGFYESISKSIQKDLDSFCDGSFKNSSFILKKKALSYLFPDVELKESIILWQKICVFFTKKGAEDFKHRIEDLYPLGLRVSCINLPYSCELNQLRNAIVSGKLTFKN